MIDEQIRRRGWWISAGQIQSRGGDIQRHQCAGSAVRDRRVLRLDGVVDQLQRREWVRESLDEQQARDELANVKIQDSRAKAVSIRRNHNELAGVQGQRRTVAQGDEALAFQHHDLETAIAENRADDGGAQDGGGCPAVFNGATAFAGGRVKQDAAALQINAPARGLERENGVGADAGYGVVCGGQFHARSGPGAHEVGCFEQFIRLRRCGGLGGSGDNFGVVDNFSEDAFGEWSGCVRGETGADKQTQECGFNVCSWVIWLRPSLHPDMTCQRNNGAEFEALTNGSFAVKR
jgi:hypothetical protein